MYHVIIKRCKSVLKGALFKRAVKFFDASCNKICMEFKIILVHMDVALIIKFIHIAIRMYFKYCLSFLPSAPFDEFKRHFFHY